MQNQDAVVWDTGGERLVAGRYRLLSVLSAGGMGTVWYARDEVLQREVAVKEVRASAGLPAERITCMYARLELDAWAAARVDARSVVTVHDVVSFDGRPWIVMEFVRGRSLADAIGAEGALAPKEAARIGVEVLAALRAAHSAGVLHRDVKPANVLLADDGRVVLTDFGIATLQGDTALTMTGEVVGSPEYLAPDRLLGRTPGTASDLWSLGALLYRAVQGRSPFRRTSALATLRAVVDEEMPPPHRAGPLASVIVGLMRKDPEERMSAQEAAHRLRAVAEMPAADEAGTATSASAVTASATGAVTAAVTAALEPPTVDAPSVTGNIARAAAEGGAVPASSVGTVGGAETKEPAVPAPMGVFGSPLGGPESGPVARIPSAGHGNHTDSSLTSGRRGCRTSYLVGAAGAVLVLLGAALTYGLVGRDSDKDGNGGSDAARVGDGGGWGDRLRGELPTGGEPGAVVHGDVHDVPGPCPVLLSAGVGERGGGGPTVADAVVPVGGGGDRQEGDGAAVGVRAGRDAEQHDGGGDQVAVRREVQLGCLLHDLPNSW
ncbi:serine/threonine protein kinase [Streptomyces sp. RM72]|uniref:serine/threonine-protein kinase n=1 Tax=Streptomyces sp. RM72 TaxID=1115510 RepID=UPI001B369F58|nr:serine/threonine-protein kinase [Streptomyces sp. RM72]MBQ0891457.1 serine/threonine protein kinase [Streptomyces sp. RM72]